ncbi:uncharacterized protein PV07_00118 [Cladophialophora immunda]|uniref:Uncharacterized protein n=1 Tax=Cladophialophora immunda TaxID=569365 RepID=A0A0D1ZYQ1_9EURO|nr:uncharacterized protein PV07_00118 [Cladophialophora immunda]KIW33251.1 hypothetical protein PV07_00118 [Cladophialophora immunda]OQV09869.1 hypothetical protein CLAIMM_13948 [Cladophialophora immunda]
MSGKYSVEDLLKLRASPLICKPPNLPPIEEWMGAQELSGRRPIARGVKEDQPAQSDPFQKRPTIIDTQRRTATDPDRIVLGPPRRSFASNARAVSKSQDLADDSGNTKDRSTLIDKSRNGEESESRHHERRYTQTNGRYGNRQESEELETEGRRDYERRPKWGGRDRNDQDLETEQDDTPRGFRRETQSRARLSQSWFKKDNGDAEDDKTPDWRRDRGRDRDWDRERAAKVEAEPEWMDSTEPEEPFQARTQEDFQRWKERMKAGSTAPADKVETAATSPPAEEKSVKRVVSAEPDDSMDKFFARFESKTTEQKAGPAKSHGKTRFASLFSPATEQNKQIEFPAQPSFSERPSSAQATASTASATNADQAGFARILEMLQTRSNNPTPQNQEASKPRTPLYARAAEPKTEPEPKPPTPTLWGLLSGQSGGQAQPPEQIHAAASQERYIENKSPSEQPTHTRQQSSITKDEVLLTLLRQATLAPKPQPPPPTGGGMFGLPPEPSNRAAQQRGPVISPIQAQQDPIMAQRREPRGPIFDESPIAMYQSEQIQREQPARRPTNGTQPAYSVDPLMALLGGQAPPHRPMQPTQPPQALPPGLQRPPGLDQMPRQNPSWPPQQPQQPPQPSRQPSLPPGLANLPRGMSGPPYSQPQQIPTLPTLPQQQRPQQPQPQRKYTAESSGMPPNLPPGMYPPPGFMNAGPPPGFPSGLANHPAARYGGDPAAQQRAFMEMYGEVGGRGLGLRGGAGNSGMPPYR